MQTLIHSPFPSGVSSYVEASQTTLGADGAWCHEPVYQGSEKMASSSPLAISAACAVSSSLCWTMAWQSPSATFFATHADDVYSEATTILSRTPSISRKVIVTDCVTATFSSGVPKYL